MDTACTASHLREVFIKSSTKCATEGPVSRNPFASDGKIFSAHFLLPGTTHMQLTDSLWNATSPAPPPFSTLRDGDHVDVAVIGAGITGLTAALLLSERGKRVAVLEMDRVACGESAMTTAHVTEAIDVRYHHIKRAFDHDAARVVAATLRAAIETIDSIV